MFIMMLCQHGRNFELKIQIRILIVEVVSRCAVNDTKYFISG